MDDDVKKILEENLRLTKEVHAMTKKIKTFVLWQQILGVIKILLIIIPIILGIIYLPPILKEAWKNYQDIMGLKSGLELQIPAELQRYLR